MATRKIAPAKRPGRPRLKEGEESVAVHLKMTVGQRDKLNRLGGPPWVRNKIGTAKEPE